MEDFASPTAEPSQLEHLEDAAGEDLALFDGALRLTLPEGATHEPGANSDERNQAVVIRVLEADEHGLPLIQVTYQPVTTAPAMVSSKLHESRMVGVMGATAYERSAAQWPGAQDAVVATWTEDVDREEGTLTVDAMGLWVDTPSGGTALVMVLAPHGELEQTSVYTALRTLTIG